MSPDSAQPRSPRLLLCFPSFSFARKAMRSGLDLWLVLDEEQQAVFAPLATGRMTPVNPRDETAVAGAVAGVVRRCGTTHVLDGEGFPAISPAEAGGAESARAPHVLADDRRLEEVLARSRHPLVRTRVAAAAQDVAGAVAEIGRPAVIRSAGEESVVWSDAALRDWVRRSGDRTGPFAVGELVTGPEVVITTLTHDGMHRVVGITAKRAVAHGERYLHPAVMSEADARVVRAAVTAVLDLAGYEFGPAQTSVVLSRCGPRILRVRPGFGRAIPRLIEAATGLDVQTELLRALAGVPIRPPVARWCAGAELLPHLRFVAEGATPEIVEQCLDAARRRV
ncbi:hypothetical protein FKR81_11905 [Lentzea tibetensis]|uniref:ATP-grasp domain-containing protein n=1 Tax=Lentzea tibetensis TaxID=2591470 RepID=A0A563EXH2_9PSEU|nr:hypothetical protein [Lentzea tibetensis]TWP52262.1 hypothetical protein FKR81_11905 [Lentzea tibetensis]